jgi:hypothetical protein
VFSRLRLAVIAVLGAAMTAKLFLESHASEETQEIDLVNIFGRADLASTADPFFGVR